MLYYIVGYTIAVIIAIAIMIVVPASPYIIYTLINKRIIETKIEQRDFFGEKFAGENSLPKKTLNLRKDLFEQYREHKIEYLSDDYIAAVASIYVWRDFEKYCVCYFRTFFNRHAKRREVKKLRESFEKLAVLGSYAERYIKELTDGYLWLCNYREKNRWHIIKRVKKSTLKRDTKEMRLAIKNIDEMYKRYIEDEDAFKNYWYQDRLHTIQKDMFEHHKVLSEQKKTLEKLEAQDSVDKGIKDACLYIAQTLKEFEDVLSHPVKKIPLKRYKYLKLIDVD